MFRILKKYRTIFFTILAGALTILVIVCMFSLDNTTNEIAVSYIKSLGWQIEERPAELSHITLPEDFDIIYRTYNALQQESGFDLSAYKGKQLSRYSYKVYNHKNSGSEEIRANIFMYQQQIVAADISSASSGGFMHPITDLSQQAGS